MKKLNRRITAQGYVLVRNENHLRADMYGYVFEHILVAEKALGKHLPDQAVIHHVNEDRQDNRPSNLVICPDRKYHELLHVRMRAKKACGNSKWLKCVYCHKYDDPKNLSIGVKTDAWHKSCASAYARNKPQKEKDRINAKKRKYRADNLEKVKARERAAYHQKKAAALVEAAIEVLQNAPDSHK